MLLLAKTQSMGTITILDSCTRAAQSVGISHLLHSSLHRLSGGELQKVRLR
jgi:hypothetical protein